MRVRLASYATADFASVRSDLNVSAVRWGIDDILSFQESDLRASRYYAENRAILDEPCGAGYWAWKPYFILQGLEGLDDGDVLFYCDAGSEFIDSPAPLTRLAIENPKGLVLFDARPLTNRQFTKRDCFVRMDCDEPTYWDANEVVATLLVVRKCPPAVAFLREWLALCCDRAAITDDPNICGKENLPGYLQHRWDQAILSVLAAKHKLETFRNPTHWGNFLKLPAYRVEGEAVASPYGLVPEIQDYAAQPQTNSPYSTIFLINRQPNMRGKTALPSLIANRGATPVWNKVVPRISRGLKQGLGKDVRG